MKQAASVHLHMQALSDHARTRRAHLPVQAGIARPRSRKLVTSIRPRKTRACMFAQASHRHESRAHLRVNLKILASQPALPKTQRSVSECMAFKTRPEIRLYIYAADCINAHADLAARSRAAACTRRSRYTSVLPLASGLGLLLTLYAGLFIMFPLADFLYNARSGALTLEPPQCAFQGFILFYSNLRHRVSLPSFAHRARSIHALSHALPCAWVVSHSECIRTIMLALTNPWPSHCGTGSSHAFYYTALMPFRQAIRLTLRKYFRVFN